MLKIITVFMLLVLLQGCATLTTGSDQSVSIETTPPGAVCTMVREGETVGIVNPTPGSVTISKDMDPMEVTCDLDEYITLVNVIDSDFQGATLGNIILGGGVGLIIDAASGAMREYPASLRFRLQPESFTSMDDRDKYFNEIASELNDNAGKLLLTRQYKCSTDLCKKNTEKLNKQLAEDLASNEEQRNLAAYNSAVTSAD